MDIASIASQAARGWQIQGVESSGLAVSMDTAGVIEIGIEQFVLRGLARELGGLSVKASRAALGKLVLRLGAAGSSLEPLGLLVDSLQVEGVELQARAGARVALPADTSWQLDALRALEGDFQVFIRDAAWVVDAAIAMPVRAGQVDFNRVVVDHVGPNSSMGIARNGIYVDAPNLGRTDLFNFTAPEVPGADYERRDGLGARITDRGRLDIVAFVAGLLASTGKQALGRLAGREVQVMLDRTKLSGDLQLGDGALGTARHHLLLGGRARARNRIGFTAAVLGQRIVMRLSELAAESARFELLGRQGETGTVTARIDGHVTNLSGSHGPAAACVSLPTLNVKGVRWGVLSGSPGKPASR